MKKKFQKKFYFHKLIKCPCIYLNLDITLITQVKETYSDFITILNIASFILTILNHRARIGMTKYINKLFSIQK